MGTADSSQRSELLWQGPEDMWGPAWADRKCFLSEYRRLAPEEQTA